MSFGENYESLCSTVDALPNDLKKSLAPTILDRLEGGNAEMFREMGATLPKTYNVLCGEYQDAVIGCLLHKGTYLCDILLESDSGYLAGMPNHPSYFEPGSLDEGYPMLPRSVRSYYFLVDCLDFVRNGVYPTYSCDELPCALHARRFVETYFQENGIPVGKIPKRLRKRPLSVWMTDSSGYLLIIDDKSGEFYLGVVERELELQAIDNPVQYWDEHCASVFVRGYARSGSTKS